MTGLVEYVPLASSIVSALALLLLLKRYLEEARLYYLLFALMMADMLVGQVLEFYSGLRGWTPGLYKVYYYTSPLSPALGALSVLALLRYRVPLAALGVYTLGVSLVLAYKVALASVDVAALNAGPFVGGTAMEESVRILSPLLTIPGGLAMLIGGILAYRSTGRIPHVMITLGALVFMAAGALLRHGYGAEFLVMEFIGTAVLAYAFIES